MQNEWQVLHRDDENSPTLRTRYLIESLENLLQRSHEPSAEVMRQITEFIVGLPELYKNMALRTVATHLITHLNLRYLEIMTTFNQRAAQEGFDAEEVAATFTDVLPDGFQKMMELQDHLSIQSIDDLVNLGNVVVGLYRHSQLHSAENAQWWTYRLPSQCFDLLERKHLLKQTK